MPNHHVTDSGSPVLSPPGSPQLPVTLRKEPKRKRAVGRIRGASIEVILPKHWSKTFQAQAARQLVTRMQRQFNRDWELVHAVESPLITFDSQKQLETWVNQLNRQTLQVPLKGVRIGYARYTHLAQMNLKTHVMTVSRYCLHQVPEPALRYLILHELAHLKVPNHSAAFWAEIRPYVPDLKYQRRLIAAVHRIRLYEAELGKTFTSVTEPEKQPQLPVSKPVFQQLLLNMLLPGSRST